MPDLVNACDVVLGKIGYGTVSEAVGIEKPRIYVSRPLFAKKSTYSIIYPITVYLLS